MLFEQSSRGGVVIDGGGRPLVSAAIRLTIVLACGEKCGVPWLMALDDDRKRLSTKEVISSFTLIFCAYYMYIRHHATMLIFL